MYVSQVLHTKQVSCALPYFNIKKVFFKLKIDSYVIIMFLVQTETYHICFVYEKISLKRQNSFFLSGYLEQLSTSNILSTCVMSDM